jgi:phage I-like protein
MKKIIARSIIATITAKDGKAPEWFLLFKAGWQEIEGEGKFLVDETAFDLVVAYLKRRGNDLVIDYEHQTVDGTKAPAAGWITALRWEAGRGIMARTEWTDEAAQFVAKREYRYFSPVFMVRQSDKRLVGVHSVALTNAPKTNHLTPILAKLVPGDAQEEVNMEFLKQLIAKLGLADDADETAVLAALDAIKDKAPETKEVVAKDILTALELGSDETASAVVASIHALRQQTKGTVSRAEFDKLQAQLALQDAEKIVAKAMADGKITPDQKDWAMDYAKGDLAGFTTFVAKAPVVIPVNKLPGKKTDADAAELNEITLTVAKMMDVSEDDIKKYGK